jgi:hypothetical protein
MFKEWPDPMSKYLSRHDEEAGYRNTVLVLKVYANAKRYADDLEVLFITLPEPVKPCSSIRLRSPSGFYEIP